MSTALSPTRRTLRPAALFWAGALTLTCCAMLAGVALADAPPPALAKFAGQYKYAGTREQGYAIVDKALDEALSEMGMVMRMVIKKGAHDKFAETVLIEVAMPK